MQRELDFEKIGRKIREVRTEKQLTQDFIANQVDVNVSHISNIETGKSKVSLTSLVLICNALNVTLDYILENEYNAPASTIEKEIINTSSNLDKEKKEQLLRIAKVL